MDGIYFEELLTIARLLREKAVSSAELTEMMFNRIATSGRYLNCYITLLQERAITQARTADAELAAGIDRGPLHGVPIAVKDICDIEGVPTTAAMPIHKSSTATADATVIQRLKCAGAVTIGKSNLTEGVYAEHLPPYGPPLNPWKVDMWPGASSSGSGVALAAGLCFGAISSDTGGSIRLPSAANGVTGLKPTWGRVSRHGIFELAASLDHVGPMARSASDVGAILQAIAGWDENDPTSSVRPVPQYLENLGGDLSDVRVGIDRCWTTEGVDSETSASLEAALTILRDCGAQIFEVKFPDTRQIVWDWFGVCAVQTAFAHRHTFPSRRSEYGPALTSLLDSGNQMSGVEYQEVLMRRADFKGRVQKLFDTVDLVACPVMAFPTPTLQQMTKVSDEMISGLHRFTCSFTMSQNPTITMPGGFSMAGMPIAFQLVARHWEENLLVRAAVSFQNVTHWHNHHPPDFS